MNIVIPMAGFGSRFAKEGFEMPKPLINIKGKPLIQHVLESLNIDGQYHFVTRRYDNPEYNRFLNKTLKNFDSKCIITEIDKPTDGAAITALLACQNIDSYEQLMIADCDMIYKWGTEFQDFINLHIKDTENFDGASVVIKDDNPACSYAAIKNDGTIFRTAEKQVISDYRMIGCHYWSSSLFFKESVEYYVKHNLRTNNEFYISPTWNYLIDQGCRILPFYGQKDWFVPIGTPEEYIKNYGRV